MRIMLVGIFLITLSNFSYNTFLLVTGSTVFGVGLVIDLLAEYNKKKLIRFEKWEKSIKV